MQEAKGSEMQIYDNGGVSFDRFTVVLDDGSVFGMSANPLSPQGFNQYIGEAIEFNGFGHCGKRVDSLRSLPGDVLSAIGNRIRGDARSRELE